MDARALRGALERRGVVVLHVGADHRDARTLVVYLHGSAGRSQQELAVQFIAHLSDVAAVEVSEHSWTILRVRLNKNRQPLSG